MLDTAVGLLFLIVAGMVVIGILVRLVRILTSRLFLNMSAFFALVFLGFIALLFVLGG